VERRIYLDNAQHARAVREWVEAQKAQGVEFVLDFLPAYSPNLNLIERLTSYSSSRAGRRKPGSPRRGPSLRAWGPLAHALIPSWHPHGVRPPLRTGS
jgi:hypothetical protein